MGWTGAWGRILELWNSRSSCRSVWPRSPWRCLAGDIASVRGLTYLLVDVDNNIIASVCHAGCVWSWLCRELAAALAARLPLTLRVSQGPSADWLHAAHHPYLRCSRQELLPQ
jgi:hypothetical protein